MAFSPACSRVAFSATCTSWASPSVTPGTECAGSKYWSGRNSMSPFQFRQTRFASTTPLKVLAPQLISR